MAFLSASDGGDILLTLRFPLQSGQRRSPISIYAAIPLPLGSYHCGISGNLRISGAKRL